MLLKIQHSDNPQELAEELEQLIDGLDAPADGYDAGGMQAFKMAVAASPNVKVVE